MLLRTLDPSASVTKEDRVLALDGMQLVTQSKKTTGSNYVTITKAYDTADRVYTQTYAPSGSTAKTYAYTYDIAGNTIAVQDSPYPSGTYHAQYLNFTAVGQPGIVTFPKPSNISVRTTYTYDTNTKRLAGLLTQKLTSGTPTATLQDLAYQYDLKGNMTSLTDTVNNITHTYTYDGLNRLLTATGQGTNAYTLIRPPDVNR
jgi:YD repeat-containing protein